MKEEELEDGGLLLHFSTEEDPEIMSSFHILAGQWNLEIDSKEFNDKLMVVLTEYLTKLGEEDDGEH